MKREVCRFCEDLVTMRKEKEGIGHHPQKEYRCRLSITRHGTYRRIAYIKKCPKEIR